MEYFAYQQKEFVYKYIVMLSDTDQFKHMSFANYLRLMFLATDALFTACLTPEFLAQRRLKVLNARFQFRKQSTSGDQLLVKVNASEIIRRQFSLLYTYVIEDTGELVGLGKQNVELLRLGTNLPEELLTSIQEVLSPILVSAEHLLYKY